MKHLDKMLNKVTIAKLAGGGTVEKPMFCLMLDLEREKKVERQGLDNEGESRGITQIQHHQRNEPSSLKVLHHDASVTSVFDGRPVFHD